MNDTEKAYELERRISKLEDEVKSLSLNILLLADQVIALAELQKKQLQREMLR